MSMLSDATSFGMIALICVNIGVVTWILVTVRSQPGGVGQLDVSFGGRLEAAERRLRDDAEGLRRALTDMDQALRREIATGAKDGLALAFDKVQEGTKAQSEELGRFGGELQSALGKMQTEITVLAEKVGGAMTDLRSLVIDKLTDAEGAAAEGRAQALRDTTEAIARTRDVIDKALTRFGEQQGERLVQMERGVREGGAATERTLTDQRGAIIERLSEGRKEMSDRLRKELGELADRVRTGFDGFSERLRQEQEQLRGIVSEELREMRAGNEAKLEQIQKAVDEQLQSALGKRLEESFQRVTEQFAQVQQAIGQVQNVAGQVGDLKRLFSNVKARGGWGEAHIRALLDDVLPAGAYEANLRIGDAGTEVVEFALRMPVKDASSEVWLPIDAKFPTEDYDRLLLACEAGDREEEMAARKALERRIRDEGKRIASKYIYPPQTVEFAVMYLPTEGLFFEVNRTPGLVETLRRHHAVMVVGPGLLPPLLHCVRVGHLTLALEQKAGVIGEILAAVKAEWGNLGKSLDTLARRAETLSNGIKDTQRRSRAVGKSLRTVEALDFSRAEQVLGLPVDGVLLKADLDDEEGGSGLMACVDGEYAA
jgi:DNA recombination protein RmuC